MYTYHEFLDMVKKSSEIQAFVSNIDPHVGVLLTVEKNYLLNELVRRHRNLSEEKFNARWDKHRLIIGWKQ